MIYLASASPRRRELLRQLGLDFEAIPSGIDEVPQPGESPGDFVLRVARDKARHVTAQLQGQGRHGTVLGADTEVVLDGEILGKPRNRAHAQAMLKRLGGRTHEVISGLCLIQDSQEYTALCVSRVTFRPLADAEIADYWDTGEPVDKAGAYAIQGRAASYIARLEGSYSGVMGLPLFELAGILRDLPGGE